MRSGTSRIEIPQTPPSLNKLGARGAPRQFHRTKRRWQGMLESHLTAVSSGYGGMRPEDRLPRPSERITASAVLSFPTNRRRDEGNYRSMLEKALGDALTNGGWLTDDTPEHFRFDRVEFEHRPGEGALCEISLAWEAT